MIDNPPLHDAVAEKVKKPVLYTVVPVFNEEPNVERLLASLAGLRDNVAGEMRCSPLIVNDGSTDATSRMLENQRGELAMTVLTHEHNMGPGAAFGTAFEHLGNLMTEDDWVVTMEGDNTSRIETLLQMLTRRKEGYDVVLASPYAYGGRIESVSASRLFLSHGANALARFALGLWGFHTLSSFFRLYSARILRQLQTRHGARIVEFDGFECMVELLLKLALAEARISEVELHLDWENRKGRSKLRLLPAILGYLKLLLIGKKWR